MCTGPVMAGRIREHLGLGQWPPSAQSSNFSNTVPSGPRLRPWPCHRGSDNADPQWGVAGWRGTVCKASRRTALSGQARPAAHQAPDPDGAIPDAAACRQAGDSADPERPEHVCGVALSA